MRTATGITLLMLAVTHAHGTLAVTVYFGGTRTVSRKASRMELGAETGLAVACRYADQRYC